ncbi:MAG TPA: hypothetical protein VNH82_03030 [Candidatus Dormibacteraeota bacterium]|nr:hypothetical protein [Candidatus Dormibacteraeota bacterium]
MARPGLIPQLTVGSLAVAVTGLVAVQILNLGPLLPQIALTGGVGALVAAALAVGLRRPRLVSVAGVGLVLAYALAVVQRPDSSVAAASAPVIAGGIFLSTQLGWWATELRTTARESAVDLTRRGAQLGASAVAIGVIAEVIWQAGRIHLGQGLQFMLLGLLAAIGLVALFLGVVTRRRYARNQLLSDQPALQPRSADGHSGLVSTPKRFGRLVAPADATSSRVAHNRVALRTMIAAILLLTDAAVTAVDLHYSGAKNAAPGIALGLIVAGAIVLAWLGLSLGALVRPVADLEERPLTHKPPPPADLGSLGVIRSLTRRAWRTGRCDAEFGTYLVSLGDRLAGEHEMETVPRSVADIGALLADLERAADA